MIEECIKILQGQTNFTSKRDQSIVGDFLQHIPYFKGICSKEELQDRLFDLAKFVEYEEIPEHEAVFHKGEQSQFMYIILKGSISVFIPKPPQDIDLEVKWRQSLELLNEEYKNISPSSLLSSQNRQQILSQINQGKSILRCLRNQEDEELLKVNYYQKYFRQGGTLCGYKKIRQLSEFDSFGESILSQQKSQRTATLIAHKGVLVKYKQPIQEDTNYNIPSIQDQSNNLSQNYQIIEEINHKINSNSYIPSLDENQLNYQQQQSQQQFTSNSKEEIQQQQSQQLSPSNSPSNISQMRKVIILGKISKKNYLKVFQQELERRTFIRRALLNNFKNDLQEGVLDNLAFFFKEEHLEKNTKIIKEFESAPSPSKSIGNNGSMSERMEYNQCQRKRAQEIIDNPIYSHPNHEEEFLYLLFRGQIEIRKKMISNQVKSQVKNIESSLQDSAVSRVSKVDLRLAQLSEGEFFGHENWFKEEIERMFSYVGEVTPVQAFQDKLIQLKKDFSIVALETDTIIYKIPRKILCEEQNRSLLRSLISHGKQRHNRYFALSKEAAEKQEENILKKLQLQNEYFISEKDNKQKEIAQFSSQKAENLMRGKKIKNKVKSGSNLFTSVENENEDSPLFKKDLMKEFDSFKMKFETVYNTSACQPISSSPTKQQKCQTKRGLSSIELPSSNRNNSNNQKDNFQNSQILVRSPSKRETSQQVFSSHNFTAKAEELQKPVSLYNLESEETIQPIASQRKQEFLIRQNRRQRSMYNMNEFNEESAIKSIPSINNISSTLKFGLNEQKSAREINQYELNKQIIIKNEDNQGLHHKEIQENAKLNPFFTESFGQTRDKIIRRYIKNAGGNPPVPKFSSVNVSPSNRNNEDINQNEIVQKSNYLKLKLTSQKSVHLTSDSSPVMIKHMSTHNPPSVNPFNSSQIYSFVQGVSGSQTARNYREDTNEEISNSPTVIKALNLSPRKQATHKSTRSLINLKQVQELEKLQNGNEKQEFQQVQDNNHDQQLYQDSMTNFAQLFAKVNNEREEIEFENLNIINKDSSPGEKRVKFQLQLPNQEKKEQQSHQKQNQQNGRSNIEFIKNIQKKIPFLKNSFLQQINMKKEIFKNEIVKKSISSLHEQLNKQSASPPQQIPPINGFNKLVKQKSSAADESPSRQNPKRGSGFYTTRTIEPDPLLFTNFNANSQQINNINISSSPLIQRQTSQGFFANSAQNSPRNQPLKKIKTFSIHSNPISNNQQIPSLQLQSNLTQSQFKPHTSLPLKNFKGPQQYNPQTQVAYYGSYTDRDQLSSSPGFSKENSWKEDNQIQNIRIFEDRVQRVSENISINETKIQSAQDLDFNMVSQETAANSQDLINIGQKPTHFSQFKINKQFMFDVPKKTVSKQIIQNCFKKK